MPLCLSDIIKFRKRAWDPITSRKHELSKVFIAENEKDVMVLGRVTMGHKNGEKLTETFTGNFVFGDKGLIQSYQALMVSPYGGN